MKLIVITAMVLITNFVLATSIPKDTVIAEFNGGKITMGDLDEKISKIPAMYQTKYNSVDGKKDLLDIMCTEEIFYLEALKQNMDKDENVMESIETQQKSNYAREFKKDLQSNYKASDDEKREYFVEHQDEFKGKSFEEAASDLDRVFNSTKLKEYIENYKNDLISKYNVQINDSILEKMNLDSLEANSHLENEILIDSSNPQIKETLGQYISYLIQIPNPYRSNILKVDELKKSLEQRVETSVFYQAALEQGYDKKDNIIEMNEQLERNVILRSLYNKLVVDAVSIDDDILRKDYEKNLDKYSSKASRKIKIFAFNTEKTAKKYRKKIKKAYKKNDSETIETIIKENSLKPEKKGVIDHIYKNDIVPGYGKDDEFNKKIWDTPANKLSDIYKNSKDEYVFFKVIEDKPVVTKPFEDVKERIRASKSKSATKDKFEEVSKELETKYALVKYPDRMIVVLPVEEYFNKAADAQKNRRYNDAIFYYDQITKYYQNNVDDYKASFMKAFLYAEELSQKDKAIELFEQFLTQYESGDLNDSAEFMLKDLKGEAEFPDEFNEMMKNSE
jgi:peptidyl-prolyl cis-trans isomerase C